MFKLIKECRVCKNTNLETIFQLKDQALTGVFPNEKNSKITTGDLDLVKCDEINGCGLVQLRQSYDISEMYGMNYGYRSGLNKSMVEHLKSKVNSILKLNILKEGDLVIDIGSNDATTLKAYPQNKYNLVGVDPTGIKFASFYPDNITLISDFFSSDIINKRLSGKKAKVITSFSMFYDLEDPVDFVKNIFQSLDDDGLWIFEQSYFPTMLKNNSFDTICHEHLEFYSLKQINWILDKAEMQINNVEFNDINGGSFSVTASKKSSIHNVKKELINEILHDETKIKNENYSSFKLNIEKSKNALLSFLKKAKEEGKKVYGLGASTKGNVLLQHYQINDSLLIAIGEVNSDKFGCFTPGTNIPMIPEDEMLSNNPDYILVLPWHFKNFFVSLNKLKGQNLIFPLPFFEIITV